jgi:hydrogenase expression/formation protein HypE
VPIVTGDTKVVERGACDRLFITTSGIGVIRSGLALGCERAQPGDVVLVNGTLGDHGATILAARGDLHLETPLVSDCAPLHELIGALLDAAPHTRLLRDATRGGLAAVLHEVAVASGVEIELREADLPIQPAVQGLCELLGLDPLYLANEGKLAAVVPADELEAALAAMRAHPYGRAAAAIGRVSAGPGRVVMRSVLGGRRLVDLPVGEPLPRIC